MPPLVPASTSDTPLVLQRSYAASPSFQLVLPPSMMMSPLPKIAHNAAIVSSVGLPEGTLIQTIFGEPSLPQSSLSPVDAVAAPAAACATASALRSYTTTWCPPWIKRVVIFAPILP